MLFRHIGKIRAIIEICTWFIGATARIITYTSIILFVFTFIQLLDHPKGIQLTLDDFKGALWGAVLYWVIFSTVGLSYSSAPSIIAAVANLWRGWRGLTVTVWGTDEDRKRIAAAIQSSVPTQ